MTDPTAALFKALEQRRHVPTLEKVQGSVRFELEHDQQTDYWLVAIKNGDISVSQEKRDADCVVRTGKGLFDRVASGQENAIAALLRGAVLVEGELELLVLVERLLPGPPGARDPRQARRARRPS